MNENKEKINRINNISRWVQTDINTYLQPRPEKEGLKLAYGLPYLHTEGRSILAEKAKTEIDERAKLLAVLGGQEEPFVFNYIHAYLYSDRVRKALFEDFKYLAASFIIWKDHEIFAPAIDRDIGQNIIRPPWLSPDGLYALRFSFWSILSKPDSDLGNWHATNSEGVSDSSISNWFPFLNIEDIDECIQEELGLIFPACLLQTDVVENFIVFFHEWLKETTKGSCKDEYFTPLCEIFSLKSNDNSHIRIVIGRRLFWFLVYGIFLRGMLLITNRFYEINSSLPKNPYKEAFESSEDYLENAELFYIPHAKVISAFIEIALHLRNEFKGYKDKSEWKSIQNRIYSFLSRVSAVSKRNVNDATITDKLKNFPDWCRETKYIRSDLAGVRFKDVFAFESTTSPKTNNIKEAIIEFGFSPHNLFHYLASDISNSIQRAVFWFPLQQLTPEKNSLLVFVANVDENVEDVKVKRSRLLGLKSIFAPIGRLCLDLYHTKQSRELERLWATGVSLHSINIPLDRIENAAGLLSPSHEKYVIDTNVCELLSTLKFIRCILKEEKAELSERESFTEYFISLIKVCSNALEQKELSTYWQKASNIIQSLNSENLYEAILSRFSTTSDKLINSKILYNANQVKVTVNGLITNALKYNVD